MFSVVYYTIETMPRIALKTTLRFLFLFALFFSHGDTGALEVGIGKAEITPPIGTPSAGYPTRMGKGMEGVHDPLTALALVIDNGQKRVAFCSVDHFGFTYEMVQEIRRKTRSYPELAHCEIYIGSSHTHSGGGAFLNIPIVGKLLAGDYRPEIARFYVDRTVQALREASQTLQPARIGIGYGEAAELSIYRALWPEGIQPLKQVMILKVTDLAGIPLAVLFNYPLHPTFLGADNLQFSADFVAYARDRLQSLLGSSVAPIYFNGAQGDIIPNRTTDCAAAGKSLAETAYAIWCATGTEDQLKIDTFREAYSFQPQATSQGITLPVERYDSEINVILLNQQHALVTIPGELSCIYDRRFKAIGETFGLSHVSIFGLTNDAHGYIITPESWEHKTYESRLSFGGMRYGERVEEMVFNLLQESSLQK